MPPRRSARLVELANPHFQLPFPPNVVALLFSLLPLDARLRAREVCRGWRFFLKDASFWTRVDLSEGCGVNPRFLASERLALALLRAACVRAQGSLQSVDLSGVNVRWQQVSLVLQWADALSAANKASLRDLVAPHCYPLLNLEQVTALCRTLPLCRVRCGVICHAVDALPLLRREAPFALLTIDQLYVSQNPGGEQAVQGLASALSGYKGMEKLHLHNMMLATRAVVDALVNASISAGIKDVHFEDGGLSRTALPVLGRLLQSPDFEGLQVCDNGALFEGPTLPAFCEALRNCMSLKTLELGVVNLWADVAVATQLIAAIEGLPALQELAMGAECWGVNAQRAAGECLARLIIRSTSLRVLNVSMNELSEAGMAPIFETLRNNSSLSELALRGELISAEFAHDVVLPAMRANTSLMKLGGLRSVDEEPMPELREVEDILEARRLADEEAA